MFVQTKMATHVMIVHLGNLIQIMMGLTLMVMAYVMMVMNCLIVQVITKIVPVFAMVMRKIGTISNAVKMLVEFGWGIVVVQVEY
jgi:hypothetical protein